MRKSKQTLDAERNQVDRLLQQGYEDKDIMRELGITRAVFYNIKRFIYQQEAEVFKKQTPEDIAYKITSLHARLVSLFSLVATKLENSSDSTKGEYAPTKDYAATAKVAQELAINIFRLETQGIQVANSEFNRSVRRLEDQLLPESVTTTIEPNEADATSEQ